MVVLLLKSLNCLIEINQNANTLAHNCCKYSLRLKTKEELINKNIIEIYQTCCDGSGINYRGPLQRTTQSEIILND